MLTASNGIKVGVIGLAEREWLDTINSLPPDIIYKSASATAKELIPGLKEQGAEIIVCVSHQREPNDNKLAEKTGGDLIDIILGGHDLLLVQPHQRHARAAIRNRLQATITRRGMAKAGWEGLGL
jgi:2',3'-cyclic-nucleotide 2'-phosphodiesterase (5'-nucleotidase family)